jgi:hypothetical protein
VLLPHDYRSKKAWGALADASEHTRGDLDSIDKDDSALTEELKHLRQAGGPVPGGWVRSDSVASRDYDDPLIGADVKGELWFWEVAQLFSFSIFSMTRLSR